MQCKGLIILTNQFLFLLKYLCKIHNYFGCLPGPLPTTTNDFWRMVWEQECSVIVMLTGLNENGKVRKELDGFLCACETAAF